MPSPALMHKPVGDRLSAGDPRGGYVRIADTPTAENDGVPAAPYFPEGGVAAPPFMIVNPISHGPESPEPGGVTGSPNLLVGPADARWIRVRDSDEQGKGVDPNRRWPRQFHSETYDLSSMAVMPFPDQIGPGYLTNLNRPEKAGWSAPRNPEQYEQQTGSYSMQELAQTDDPQTMAFALGWGSVG